MISIKNIHSYIYMKIVMIYFLYCKDCIEINIIIVEKCVSKFKIK